MAAAEPVGHFTVRAHGDGWNAAGCSCGWRSALHGTPAGARMAETEHLRVAAATPPSRPCHEPACPFCHGGQA